MLWKASGFRGLTRSRSFGPFHCLLRHRCAITRIQRTPPRSARPRGASLSSHLAFQRICCSRTSKYRLTAECRKATLCPTLRGRPFCRAKKGVWRGANLWNKFAVALGIAAAVVPTVIYNLLIYTYLCKVLPLIMIWRTLSYRKIITSLQNTPIMRCFPKHPYSSVMIC